MNTTRKASLVSKRRLPADERWDGGARIVLIATFHRGYNLHPARHVIGMLPITVMSHRGDRPKQRITACGDIHVCISFTWRINGSSVILTRTMERRVLKRSMRINTSVYHVWGLSCENFQQDQIRSESNNATSDELSHNYRDTWRLQLGFSTTHARLSLVLTAFFP